MTLIDVTDFVNTGGHLKKEDFGTVETDLMCWGLCRFCFNWETNLDDCVNQLAREVFWISFFRAIKLRPYKYTISQHVLTREIVIPVLLNEFNNLSSRYRFQCSSVEVLEYHDMVHEKAAIILSSNIIMGVHEAIVAVFQPRNCFIMGSMSKVKMIVGDVMVDQVHVVIPRWWSDKAVRFMRVIEGRIQAFSNIKHTFPGTARVARKYVTNNSNEYGVVPRHLPADLYSEDFKNNLLPSELVELKMKPTVLPDSNQMGCIFPMDEDEFFHHESNSVENEYYSSDNNDSSDELDETKTDLMLNTTQGETCEIKRVEMLIQTQISNLHKKIDNTIESFTEFQSVVRNSLPLHLAELDKAREDITNVNRSLDELRADLISAGLVTNSAKANVTTNVETVL
ncbi:uncharacterized protein MELLADRAFT_96113 [Melampsora larici-populina 98AG31]|uniref:Uncharacterized protein n=1 Tax=Melampsora larici-populina (strain 98AG31 / pathotype 3-4-7) TaxID=747676 RepID=F4SB07_MELLP|nr:uncharacterized protein MELLADRAFT_96113 [Melampsora larici-populina 98AG31]EGF98171.1 hypothetical protein MELLADRAFT_96113 [Melampsora larici-populina 98AG31]